MERAGTSTVTTQYTNILVIETASGDATGLCTTESAWSSYNWEGAVTLPDGRILFVPDGAPYFIVITPNSVTPTSPTITTYTGPATGYSGGVLGANGQVYCVPNGATTVMVFNPLTNTYTTFGSVSKSYVGGALAPDGSIYCFPVNGGAILKINTINNTLSTIASPSGSDDFATGVLAPNGNIYSPAYLGGGAILEINTGFSDIPLNLCLSPYLNKGF